MRIEMPAKTGFGLDETETQRGRTDVEGAGGVAVEVDNGHVDRVFLGGGGEKGIRKLGQIDEVDIFVVALLKDFFFLLAGVPIGSRAAR